MPGALVVVVLAIWVGAIAVLVHLDRVYSSLWIPTLLALVGLFTSCLTIVLDPITAVVMNLCLLLAFAASLAIIPKPPSCHIRCSISRTALRP